MVPQQECTVNKQVMKSIFTGLRLATLIGLERTTSCVTGMFRFVS
jgi:hypothetical protein